MSRTVPPLIGEGGGDDEFRIRAADLEYVPGEPIRSPYVDDALEDGTVLLEALWRGKVDPVLIARRLNELAGNTLLRIWSGVAGGTRQAWEVRNFFHDAITALDRFTLAAVIQARDDIRSRLEEMVRENPLMGMEEE